ncbi:hypothetical protein [Rhizobium sp. L245/93]|uniref:hypothetical protein n=1 Tax=Rhizobium sp. L245/93 TaxID=2819998 RepID=UPI001ADB204E|nr:hypothetical protein [Rhizobium sp. L245/93]MBO9170902.1 hypothetical protein [Rhizobium sp. L245/93]
MNHRRGINLTREPDPPFVERPTEVADLLDVAYSVTGDLHSWMLLGGKCGACEREGWIDRDWFERRYRNNVISELVVKLRCRRCGNKTGNKFILGKLPR